MGPVESNGNSPPGLEISSCITTNVDGCWLDAVCWRTEPEERPKFVDILLQLEEISNSPFITTSHASFRSLQLTWRVEIESRFAELSSRDDVRACILLFISFV